MSTLDAKRGNTRRALATTRTAIAVMVSLPPASCTRGAKRLRSCSRSVTSASSCWVTCGMVVHEVDRCTAVVRRMPLIGSRSTSPQRLKSGNGGGTGAPPPPAAADSSRERAVRTTSPDRMRPPLPVPCTEVMSTPSSRANRRVLGVAGIGHSGRLNSSAWECADGACADGACANGAGATGGPGAAETGV